MKSIKSPAFELVRVLTFAGAIGATAGVDAEVPAGVLFEASVGSAAGALEVTFSVYDAPVGGLLLYAESDGSVAVSDGLLQSLLGDGPAALHSPSSALGDVMRGPDPRYVEIAIGGEPLQPRLRMAARAYSLRAGRADDTDLVGPLDSTDLQLAPASSCPPGSSIRTLAPDGTIVCEPDDGANYVAGAGLGLASGLLAVDPGVIQLRIGGSCAPGSYIAAILEDGTLSCTPDVDNDTTYSAGLGLVLDSGEFSIDASIVQRRVVASCPANQALQALGEDGNITCAPYTSGTVTGILPPRTSGLSSGCAGGDCIVAISTSSVQARITGICAQGAIRTVLQDGTVDCAETFDGDITAVATPSGRGLDGGCFAGTCSLSVDFAEFQRTLKSQCNFVDALTGISAAGSIDCTTVPGGDITGVITAGFQSGLSGGCTSQDCTLVVDPTDFNSVPQGLVSSSDVQVSQFWTSPNTVLSRSMTAPPLTGGHIVAIATATMKCNGNCAADLYSALGTDASSLLLLEHYTLVTADNIQFPLFLTDVFPLSAGQTKTVRWRAGVAPGHPASTIYKPRLTVMFVPD